MNFSLKERLILRLYPGRVRRAAGEQLVLWWREWAAQQAHRNPISRAMRFLLHLIRDVTSTHSQERVKEAKILRTIDTTPRGTRMRRWLGQQPTELRHAARSAIRRAPSTLLGTLTLGIGVAAVSVVLVIVDTVVLQPLPYPEADRLVRVGNASDEPGQPDVLYALSGPDFRELENRVTTLNALGASRLGRFTVFTPNSPGAATGDLIPESLLGAYVSAGFFGAVRVIPQIGRTFTRNEDLEGTAVVVLSAELANRHFGGRDPLGEVLNLDQTPFEVVGVMPASFEPPEGIFQGGAAFWVPFGRYPAEVRLNRADTFLAAVGRLAGGATLEGARAELATLGQVVSAQYPEADERVFGASPLKLQTIGDFATTLWTLLGAVALLMLVAGANLASLQLAAGIDRRREFAVRRSLGADRSQIFSQTLNECLLLGAGASFIGGLAAWSALRLVRAGIAVDVPRIQELQPGAALAWICIALGVGGALCFGLVPQAIAARLRPGRLAEALRSGARNQVGSRGQERTRGALVIIETALAVVLVSGAGLLLSSYVRLSRVDLGFEPGSVEGAVLLAPQENDAALRAYYGELVQRTQSLPATDVAGLASITPLGGGRQMQGLSFERADLAQELTGGEPYPAHYQVADGGFLDALSIPILDGRGFEPADANPDRRTVLVNQAIADEISATGVDPVGIRFELGEHGLRPEPFEIVGVVGSTQQNRLSDPRLRRVYFHYDQVPRRLMRLFVKTQGDVSVLPEVRNLVAELAPEQPVLATFQLDDVVERSLGEPRFYVQLVGSLAVVAATLALVGVYSTLRFLVLRRRREVGLRMAMGATQRSILRLVVGRGLSLVSMGLILGVGAALGLTQLLDSFLFEVAPRDPSTYAAVVACLLVAGFVASFWPAREAARTAPASVLGDAD